MSGAVVGVLGGQAVGAAIEREERHRGVGVSHGTTTTVGADGSPATTGAGTPHVGAGAVPRTTSR